MILDVILLRATHGTPLVSYTFLKQFTILAPDRRAPNFCISRHCAFGIMINLLSALHNQRLIYLQRLILISLWQQLMLAQTTTYVCRVPKQISMTFQCKIP